MSDSKRANIGATNLNWIDIHEAGFGIIDHIRSLYEPRCWLRAWDERTNTDVYGIGYRQAAPGSAHDEAMRQAISECPPALAAIEARKLDAATAKPQPAAARKSGRL